MASSPRLKPGDSDRLSGWSVRYFLAGSRRFLLHRPGSPEASTGRDRMPCGAEDVAAGVDAGAIPVSAGGAGEDRLALAGLRIHQLAHVTVPWSRQAPSRASKVCWRMWDGTAFHIARRMPPNSEHIAACSSLDASRCFCPFSKEHLPLSHPSGWPRRSWPNSRYRKCVRQERPTRDWSRGLRRQTRSPYATCDRLRAVSLRAPGGPAAARGVAITPPTTPRRVKCG